MQFVHCCNKIKGACFNSVLLLIQVCLDSRVESIIPDYPIILDLPEGSGDVTEEDNVDCSKLILTEPYTGEDYSIVLKPRTSITDLYNIISRIEIEKKSNEGVSFNYHYTARRGAALKLIVTMNIKALELVSINSATHVAILFNATQYTTIMLLYTFRCARSQR